MKTSSDLLWQLIKSLKGAEKTYFKRNFISFQSGTQKNYIKLFDAIAAQKKYDEAAILKKLAPQFTKKNIAFQKHYLQKQIYAAIIEYDNKDSIRHELYNQLLLIRVLRKRGLSDSANTLWQKTVAKARTNEIYPILTMLANEFEKMILSGSTETQYEDLHTIFKGRFITYNDYAELISLRDIYTEILLLKRKAHFDIDNELVNRLLFLQEFVNKINLKKETKSFWFKHYYFLSKATLLYLLNNAKKAMPFLTQAYREWKNNPHFIEKDGEFFIELLYMINQVGIQNGEYDFVMNSFNEALNNSITDTIQKANFEAIKFLAFNKIYNKTARYNEVNKLAQSIKISSREWEPLLNADLNRTINISLGISCFVLEQFEDALYYVKRSSTYFRDGTRQEHYAIAHILLLLISFSMDNDRIFETEYRATYTYFYKRKKKHPFESAFVQCLQRSFYMTHKKMKIKEYKRTLKIFEENKNDPFQQVNVSIFNYPVWLVSKIEDIPYRKYVEKKLRENGLNSIA